MSATSQSGGLPAGLRRMAWVALIVGALCGADAARGVGEVFQTDSLRGAHEGLAHIFQATLNARANALDSMTLSRAMILVALSLSTSLLWLAALRLLRPSGEPREPVRRMLVAMTVATAVLRTLDGAQSAALGLRMDEATLEAIKTAPPTSDWLEQMVRVTPPAYALTSMLFTAIFATTFVAIAAYFRSDRVRVTLEEVDRLAL